MNEQKDWDPDQYLKFKDERTQPSIDLVNKINIAYSPKNIVDIGCGPGNSSQVLLRRWPQAQLVGVDNSPAMIAKAKNDHPKQEWILSGADAFESTVEFDLIFSNATIQWIPDHESLFAKFINLLSGSGVIAMQVPQFQDMPLSQAIHSVSLSKRWGKKTAGCAKLFTYHDSHYYYDLLAAKMKRIDMWETDYIHVMPSHLAIMDWIKSTGMKPYLDRLGDENDKKDFVEEVLNETKKCYAQQKNGNILFPFKRLFFIGYK